MRKDTPLHGYAMVSHKVVKEVICDNLSLLMERRGNSMTISGESGEGGWRPSQGRSGLVCRGHGDSSWGLEGEARAAMQGLREQHKDVN